MQRESVEDVVYPEPISRKIIVDPQKLIKLKRERQPFQMIKSRFEPPEAPQPPTPAGSPVKPLLPALPRHSNIELVSSLIDIEFSQLYRLEEAEEISLGEGPDSPLWVVVAGEVRFTTRRRRVFTVGEGFMFFLSEALRDRYLLGHSA